VKELQDWRVELEVRIDRLKHSMKSRDSCAPRLMASIGGQLMLPRRMSTLSAQEEDAGGKATSRELDATLWLAAFGDEKELEKVLANPLDLIENREQLVVGFSDQTPALVKIGRNRQVYWVGPRGGHATWALAKGLVGKDPNRSVCRSLHSTKSDCLERVTTPLFRLQETIGDP